MIEAAHRFGRFFTTYLPVEAETAHSEVRCLDGTEVGLLENDEIMQLVMPSPAAPRRPARQALTLAFTQREALARAARHHPHPDRIRLFHH